MVKQSSFMLAFFAIALLAISFASANLVLTNTSATSVNVEQGNSVSVTFNVRNTNDIPVLVSFTNSTASGITSSIPATITVANNTTSNSLTVTFYTSLTTTSVGERSITLTAAGNDSNSSTLSFNVNVTKSILYEICGAKYAPQNISFGDVEDNEAENDNEWEWMPSNKISITVNDVENKVDDDEKFDIYLLFYQGTTRVSGSKIASDDDNLDNKDLKIDAEDEENAEFEFDVANDADSENYDMYVKVDGKYGCYVEKITSVSIDTEDGDYSIVSNVNGPTSSSCAETVDLTATVSNIGDEDAERVKVILYNKELGINLFKEIDNLDQGDESIASFSFVVPQNAVEKSYKLLLYTEFSYDEDDNEYGEESDSEYDYTYTLGLSGNCADPTKPTVTAKLNSTAVVGEELVVAVTFKNNANTSVSAILAPEDFESWAELVSVTPSTITVGRAEAKTVYMTFKPSKEGAQTFNLNAIYNGKSMDLPVTLAIEANTGLMSYLKEQLGSTGAYLALGIAVLIALILLVLVIKLILWLVRKH